MQNVHRLVARLVLSPEGDVKESMFLALRTTLNLDDALDLAEIDDWGQSWRAATQRNQDTITDIIRKRQERDQRCR